MSVEEPTGPFILSYDGSEGARTAITRARVLLGERRPARLLYVYKPTERSLGVAQAAAGGRIDAPVSSEPEAEAVVEAGVELARSVGFDAEGLLVAADRPTAEIISSTAEDLDAPAIVMGQRGHSGLKSAVLGSVSRDVVNGYHRPVIVV